MQTSRNSITNDKEQVYRSAEANANRFNLICLAVLALLALLAEILNEIGLFTVSRNVMIPSAIIAIVSLLIPVTVYAVKRKRQTGGEPLLEQPVFRKLIIVCTFIGIGVLCVAIPPHTAMLIPVPVLISAQYRHTRKTFVWALAATLLLVPVSVYGGFFFGLVDRNFLKGALTDEEALIFANRVAIATPKRMLELFLHYVLPREFGVAGVSLLAFGITRRGSLMVERQIELSDKVREEMENRHRVQNQVIDVLSNLIETRDVSTGTHIINTKKYVEIVARAMQREEKYRDLLPESEIELIKNAAPLHDVGKITVPDAILLKPARLTPEEFERMKTHTTTGEKLIKDLFADLKDIDFLETAEQIAASHHERWDGTGYPRGLKGESIPLSARIMAVADVFDALVSVRVYKDSVAPRDALDIIYSESGTHFDPDIIRVVRTVEDQMIAVAESRAANG
ncbi:MAG: HD domain-containing protein [Clostridia bacterium]|nr:HD domain-containing protein [Clostridia bacterium]